MPAAIKFCEKHGEQKLYSRRFRRWECDKCGAERHRGWRQRNVPQRLLMSARQNARKGKVFFDLLKGDIVVPKVCPVLGVQLATGPSDAHNGPSIDRINPKKGYTRDNIAVISRRANRLKNDATVEELLKIVSYMESFSSRKFGLQHASAAHAAGIF